MRKSGDSVTGTHDAVTGLVQVEVDLLRTVVRGGECAVARAWVNGRKNPKGLVVECVWCQLAVTVDPRVDSQQSGEPTVRP